MKQRVKDPYAPSSLPVRIIWGSLRFILFGGVVAIFAVALFLLAFRWSEARQGGVVQLDQGDPSLSSAERVVLQSILAFNRDALNEPIGAGVQPVEFTVSAGQNANQIAINLASSGVMSPDKEGLFLNYLRFYGLDAELDAGTFVLSPDMDVPTLAETLSSAVGDDVTLTFLEGWRVEQIAGYLDTVRPAQIDPAEFLAIVTRQRPIDTSAYPFLVQLGEQDSLEGFLFPDTYRVPLDADAPYLVNVMLQTFGERVTPEMRQAYGERGLTVVDAVNLASIVEREAVLAEEQPIIASVFLNRLDQGIKLDADPTVQYAVGYDPATDKWWKAPLTVDDLQVQSPYNTYQNTGLPPSPIANPGLGALQAVASPLSTDYLYFVAECAGLAPGAHLFSVTYEQHLANVEGCR